MCGGASFARASEAVIVACAGVWTAVVGRDECSLDCCLRRYFARSWSDVCFRGAVGFGAMAVGFAGRFEDDLHVRD